MTRNRDFNVFWLGQSLSFLGDAFSIVAIPLLVLEITGSLTQMGVVTALIGVGSLVAGIAAGPIVDRVDRRKLMIRCDLGRALVYGLVPVAWWLFGPQLGFVYAVTLIGAALAMLFGVAYITAVANLVDREQIVDANGRLQATYALAFILGPLLAGVVSSRFGPVLAIGIDGLTFIASAVSLRLLRLRQAAAYRPLADEEPGGRSQEFLAGVRFLFGSSLFRWLTILTGVLVFASTGVTDLLIFYLKEDLGQTDRVVGIVFGIASIGTMLSGLLAPRLRRSFGFGVCYIGGFALEALALIVLGVGASLPILSAFWAVSAFGGSTRGVMTMTLRQELTPDHLLGRVTAAFWTIFAVPGPLGALVLTTFGARVGTRTTLLAVGVMILGTAVISLFTPVRAFAPGDVSQESGVGR
ncbi:MAG: MFS transporter [Thermomicrobiales bacterium]